MHLIRVDVDEWGPRVQHLWLSKSTLIANSLILAIWRLLMSICVVKCKPSFQAASNLSGFLVWVESLQCQVDGKLARVNMLFW